MEHTGIRTRLEHNCCAKRDPSLSLEKANIARQHRKKKAEHKQVRELDFN